MKYAKIVDGMLEFAPQDKDGISNWINDEEAVLAEGFLPYIDSEAPVGKTFLAYKEKDGKIIATYQDNYIAQRKATYPPIEEQLDMIYWDKIEGTNIWEETITAIKKKYPHPEHSETTINKEENLVEEISNIEEKSTIL